MIVCMLAPDQGSQGYMKGYRFIPTVIDTQNWKTLANILKSVKQGCTVRSLKKLTAYSENGFKRY